MQHQRPSHNPSRNLSATETQCLHDILGNHSVTLATAVVQIFYGYNHTWQKQACGVLCYVKNYQRKLYLLCLYNLKYKETLLEETIPIPLILERVADRFYSFNGTTCKIGINFADVIEAETFSENFHKKQADRQIKRDNMKSSNQPASATVNAMHIPLSNAIKISNPPSHFTKSTNSKSSKKKLKHHPPISEPIPASFQCIMRVTQNENFVTDPTKKKLLDEILARMKISPQEEQYVRFAVAGENNGLENIFTKSIRNVETQEQSIPNHPSEIPLHIQKTRKRIPYQDISLPSANFQQKNPIHSTVSMNYEKLKGPPVPPKPVSPLSNNVPPYIKATRAPPPPIPPKSGHVNIPSPISPPPTPTDSKILSTPPPKPPPPLRKPATPPPTLPRPFPPSPSHSSVPLSPPIPTDLPNGNMAPPPLPPPLPLDLLASKENLNPPLSIASPTSPERHFLFNQICDFDLQQLKPIAERSTPTLKSTENNTNLDEHLTLEDNIRLLLEKRRIDIMGRVNDQENTTDTDDDEWDA